MPAATRLLLSRLFVGFHFEDGQPELVIDLVEYGCEAAVRFDQRVCYACLFVMDWIVMAEVTMITLDLHLTFAAGARRTVLIVWVLTLTILRSAEGAISLPRMISIVLVGDIIWLLVLLPLPLFLVAVSPAFLVSSFDFVCQLIH